MKRLIVKSRDTKVIIDILVKKGGVKVTHLGIFDVINLKPRKRYNIITKSVVNQPAGKRIRFKPTISLIRKINAQS